MVRAHQAVQVNCDKPRWVPIDVNVKQDLDGVGKLADGVPSIESRTLDDTSWVVRMSLDDASPKYFCWDTRRKVGEFRSACSRRSRSSRS